MNNLPMNTFNREVVEINRALKKLETFDNPVTSYDLVAEWNTAHAKISHLLDKLRSFALDMEIYEMVAATLYDLHQRVEHLPYVPDIRDVTRAQNVLAFSPYVIITEDVKLDKQEPPELKRVTVVSNDGIVLFDQDFLPQYVQKGSLPSWSDSTEQTAQTTTSVPLAHIWNDLTKVLSGHYILAYDLALVQVQLEVTAMRFQLPIPVLIGESILDLYIAYHGKDIMTTTASEDPKSGNPILIAIYDLLGAPFSRDTPYTAVDRAARITHILHGIANCTLTLPSQFNAS